MNTTTIAASKTTPEKKQRRLQDIQGWMRDYSELFKEQFGIMVEYIPNAAEKLNDMYWQTLDEKVRPFLEHELDHNVDRHKIASLMELCIMCVQPLPHKVEQTRRIINSQFAITVAKMIIAQWQGSKAVNKELFMRMTPSFNKEHKQ